MIITEKQSMETKIKELRDEYQKNRYNIKNQLGYRLLKHGVEELHWLDKTEEEFPVVCDALNRRIFLVYGIRVRYVQNGSIDFGQYDIEFRIFEGDEYISSEYVGNEDLLSVFRFIAENIKYTLSV